MKRAKKMLAVVLAMAMLCGAAAIGASAAKPITADFSVAMAEEIAAANSVMDVVKQLEELEAVQKNLRALSKLTDLLYTAPPLVTWVLFSMGHSVETLEADLKAEMANENLYRDDIEQWVEEGVFIEHLDDIIVYYRVLNEKYPEVLKRHCEFYVDWYINYIIARVK